MRHGPRRALGVALALLVVALAVPGGTAPPAAQERAALAGSQVDADDVSLRVDLRADGDAAWTVEYRIQLEDQNATDAFESLRADVRENPGTFTDRFRDRMAATAASAENETGRAMGIRNVTVSTATRQLPQEYGVITYRFEWTNFAAAEGGRLRAGDALRGLFLDEETVLVMAWPAEYGVASVDPSPDASESGEVRWRGPREFGPGEPALVVSTAAARTATPTTPAAPAGGWPGAAVPWVLGGLLLLALLGVGWLYRRGELGAGGGPAAGSGTGPDAGGTGGPAVAGDAGGGTDGDAEDDEPPPELLSNEERVLRLLEERGGRMKQQEVVEALDWTEAKTSQVVSSLREDEEIETFRIGRENVLTLPEESDI